MAGNFDLVLEDFPKIEIREDRPCVFFSSNLSRYYLYLHTLLARKLWEAESIPSVFLDETDDLHQYFPRMEHDDLPLNNCLVKNNYFFDCDVDGYDDGVDLQVDLEAQEILYDGLNLYDVLSASLARDKCQYEVDLTDPSLTSEVERGIKSIRQILMLADTIESFAEKEQQKVIIAGNDPNFIPNGIFLRWTQHMGTEGMLEFVHVNTAYKHYFGYERKNWVLFKNLTKTHLTNRLYLTEEEFRELESGNYRDENSLTRAQDLLGQALDSNKENFGVSKDVPEEIIRWKDIQKPVVGLFPNLLYERPMNDKTSVFSGIKDWILETVELFKKLEIPLVVKPHPSEAFNNVKIEHSPETVSDIIGRKRLPENILLLEPDQLPSKSLFPFLDLGLVWRSRIALEMGFKDIPVIVCGLANWQKHLKFPSPRSIKEYKQMIKNHEELLTGENLKQRIATYIEFLHDKPIHYPFYDAERSQWNELELKKCLEKQRPEILNHMLELIRTE